MMQNKLYCLIRTLEVITIMVHILNFIILIYTIAVEYNIYGYLFHLRTLPIKYKIFVGKSSLISTIYSLIVLPLKCYENGFKSIQWHTSLLSILSLSVFILYFMYVLNIG